MNSWVSPSIIALFSFGLWGLFTKLSVEYIDFKSALIYQTLGVVIVGVISLFFMSFKPAFDSKGIGYATLTGIAYGLGCLFYFLAASKGKMISVVTLTALYPMITIILSYFLLHETITSRQIAGISLAIISIIMMSL